MDVQEATNLTITEGEVRTIHNNGQLLWGRLNYNTTYNGDTTQQTYSGKNQFNIETFAQGSITVSDGVATGTTGQFYTEFSNGFTIANTSAVMSITATAYKEGTSSSGNGIIFRAIYTDSSTENLMIFPNSTVSETTLTATTNTAKTLDKFAIVYGAGSSNVWHLSQIQIEAGTTPTTFEKFVGGTPSPNPEYPQTVNVVTGEQTITVTDGDVSQNYTVDLGTIELCKIGTYQDYIYKSGNEWYVHNACGKVVLDGSDDEDWSAVAVGDVPRYYRTNVADALVPTDGSVVSPMKANYYSPATPASLYNATVDYGISLNTSVARFRVRNKDIATTADFKTWLSTHNTMVYYTLGTATDTKITNSTLISQLEAIHTWLTRYGYTSNVVGNLPIIINQTTLS